MTTRYPNDEFVSRRDRLETHPDIASYLATRSEDELAALIWNQDYQRNIFGSYNGTVGEHSLAIIHEVGRRAADAIDAPLAGGISR